MQVDVYLALNILKTLIWNENVALRLEVRILEESFLMELVLLEQSQHSFRLPVLIFWVELTDRGPFHVNKDMRKHLTSLIDPTIWVVALSRVSTLLEWSVV